MADEEKSLPGSSETAKLSGIPSEMQKAFWEPVFWERFNQYGFGGEDRKFFRGEFNDTIASQGNILDLFAAMENKASEQGLRTVQPSTEELKRMTPDELVDNLALHLKEEMLSYQPASESATQANTRDVVPDADFYEMQRQIGNALLDLNTQGFSSEELATRRQELNETIDQARADGIGGVELDERLKGVVIGDEPRQFTEDEIERMKSDQEQAARVLSGVMSSTIAPILEEKFGDGPRKEDLMQKALDAGDEEIARALEEGRRVHTTGVEDYGQHPERGKYIGPVGSPIFDTTRYKFPNGMEITVTPDKIIRKAPDGTVREEPRDDNQNPDLERYKRGEDPPHFGNQSTPGAAEKKKPEVSRKETVADIKESMEIADPQERAEAVGSALRKYGIHLGDCTLADLTDGDGLKLEIRGQERTIDFNVNESDRPIALETAVSHLKQINDNLDVKIDDLVVSTNECHPPSPTPGNGAPSSNENQR